MGVTYGKNRKFDWVKSKINWKVRYCRYEKRSRCGGKCRKTAIKYIQWLKYD